MMMMMVMTATIMKMILRSFLMMRTTAITITLPNTFFISTRSNVLTFVKPHNLLFFY